MAGKPDKATRLQVSRRHRSGDEASALAPPAPLAAAIPSRRTRACGGADIFDPLSLEPEAPILAVCIMHMGPREQVARAGWRGMS